MKTRITAMGWWGAAMLFLCATSLTAQELEFKHEANSIRVFTEATPVHSPFAGGFNFSVPTFADLDGDGDLDLFVGDRGGHLTLFRNLGTASNPDYALEAEKFLLIDVGNNSIPALVDIDADGDQDLFIGNDDGAIHFMRNKGTRSDALFTLETTSFISGTDRNVAPVFVDIDADEDFDLFAGGRSGKIAFYRNEGNKQNPRFVIVTAAFGGIDVESRCIPEFVDLDGDGDFDLLAGRENGWVSFYRNEGNPQTPDFVLAAEEFANIDAGRYSAPRFADLDGDDQVELYLGEKFGNLNLYENRSQDGSLHFSLQSQNFVGIDVGGDAAPVCVDIDRDGDVDLFIGKDGGHLSFLENVGNAQVPIFNLREQKFLLIDVGRNSAPEFADWDGDSDFDLFIGEKDGNINLFLNTGDQQQPSFSFQEFEFFDLLQANSRPVFVDIDADGDQDLFIGSEAGEIFYYRNSGSPSSPAFERVNDDLMTIASGRMSAPEFVDIDSDGDWDLFVGDESGKLSFFRNTGTPQQPVFVREDDHFDQIDIGDQSVPEFVDIDADGRFDLFVGAGNGGLRFYRNVTVTTGIDERPAGSLSGSPASFALSQNHPNPFNPESDGTMIAYRLPVAAQVQVSVYSLLGQRIKTLIDSRQAAGSYRIRWNGRDKHGELVATGVYLYRLEAAGHSQLRKLTVLR